MDPLSITASVVGLTATCVQTAKAPNDIKAKFQNASLTIAAICTETTIISASLSRIQSSMLGSPDGLADKLSSRPDLEATLDHALTGCYVVFDVLQAEIHKLTESAQSKSSDLSLRAKLRYVWSETTMQEILTQIRGLQTALTLLLQLLGTDKIAELKQLMDNNTMILSQVVQRTTHFRAARASRAPESIFDMSFATQSIHHGEAGSVISSTLFSFDDEIVNSQAYRKAFAKAYSNSNNAETQSVSSKAITDPVAGQVRLGSQQLLDQGRLKGAENIKSGSNLDPVNTELNQDALRFSEKIGSLTVLDTLILSPTPSNSFMEFIFGEQTQDTDWATHWKLERIDVEGVPSIELERQKILHEIITSEYAYLRSLQVVRYLYKYRLVLDSSITLNVTPIIDGNLKDDFPGCEDIYHANKTLLYDPLKSRQSSEGPWLSSFWDLFQSWLRQSSEFYMIYCSLYPMVDYTVRKEAKQNPRFSRFLDQSREHRISRKLGWESYLKCPLTRIQRYMLLLHTLLRESDRSNPKHGCSELEQLVEDLGSFVARCDVAIRQSSAKVEIQDLRSRMGDVGQRVLPNDVELQLTERMLYRESRLRDMTEVTILVIRKPDRCVVILKEVSRSKAISEGALELLAELRGTSVGVHFEQGRAEGTQQCQVILYWDTGNLTLVAPSLKGARELHKAVLAIGRLRS